MKNENPVDILDLHDQIHYNQRYRYSALLKKFLENKIDWAGLHFGFFEIYWEAENLRRTISIESMKGNPERFKTFVFTPKSKGFRSLIEKIYLECYDPDFMLMLLQTDNPNLDSEEIEILYEKDLRKYMESISRKMDAFLDS